MVTPTYISVGGFTYNFEPAVEKFRFSESTLRKALPFVRAQPDYVKLKEQSDMKDLMIKRMKDRKRREKIKKS